MFKRIFGGQRPTKEQIMQWATELSKTGDCVICGGKTRTRLHRRSGGWDFVHDFGEPDYLGCKQVWRYQQEKHHKPRIEDLDPYEFEERLALGYGVYTDRDEYHDYRSYIRSIEWELKSTGAKIKSGWRCEKCGVGGNKTTLHTHHLTYKRLYKERREDVMVLCAECHRKAHDKKRR